MKALLVVLAGCGRLGFDGQAIADADAADATIDATLACPERAGQLFCESFEDVPRLGTAEGDVVLDGTRAVRGARSLRARTTGASEKAWMIGTVLPPITSGDLYLRWWVYLPASSTPAELASVHLVEMLPPFAGVVTTLDAGRLTISNSVDSRYEVSTTVLPSNRWICLRMHVAVANTGGAIELYADDALVATIASADTLPASPYRNLHAGLYSTGLAVVPQELSTDELAVGTQPIPCD